MNDFGMSDSMAKRFATQWEIEIPANPDPDVLRLSEAFLLPYGRSKILKALSYGIPVERHILQWCSGKKPSNASRAAANQLVNYEVYAIKAIRPKVRVFHCNVTDTYVIPDEAALCRIREVMYGTPGPRPTFRQEMSTYQHQPQVGA
jgi:hypothetical protein